MMSKRSRNIYTFIINNDTYKSVVTGGIFVYIFNLYISQWDVPTKFHKDSVHTSQRTPYMLASGRTIGKCSN